MLILCLVALCVSPEQSAVARLQARYVKGDLTGQFRQIYVDKLRGKTQTESGTLWVAKDGRVRWSYLQPELKDFVYDGKTAYFYEPANGQVTVFENFDDSQLSTAVQFLWGKGDVAARFEIKPCAALCAPGRDTVVELTPKKPIPQVALVALVIDKTGLLRRTITLDPLGNRTEYQFEQLQFGAVIDAAKFTFVVPAGVAVMKTVPRP